MESRQRDNSINASPRMKHQSPKCISQRGGRVLVLHHVGIVNQAAEREACPRWATLKAGMTKRWNHGMAESRNGGKLPQILKGGIAESRNGGKYPQILKDGVTENQAKS